MADEMDEIIDSIRIEGSPPIYPPTEKPKEEKPKPKPKPKPKSEIDTNELEVVHNEVDLIEMDSQKETRDKILDSLTPLSVIIKHSFAPIIKIHRARRVIKEGITYLKVVGVQKKIIEPKIQRRYSDGKREILVFETDGKGNYRSVEWQDHEFIPLLSDEEKVAFQNTLDAVEKEYQNPESFWNKYAMQIQIGIIMIMAIVVINMIIESTKGYCGMINSQTSNALTYCIDTMNSTARALRSLPLNPPVIQ